MMMRMVVLPVPVSIVRLAHESWRFFLSDLIVPTRVAVNDKLAWYRDGLGSGWG